MVHDDGRRLVNLRDIGGLPLDGGGRTRSGVLYRSDAPYRGDLDPEGVASWPPSVVIDLRRPSEVEATGFVWQPEVRHVRHPLHDVGSVDSGLVQRLEDIYSRIMDEAADRIAAVVGMIPDEGTVLVNCAGGKDRTGAVVAVLLAAAGVEREAIVEDYLATGRSADAIKARWRVQDGLAGVTRRTAPPDLLLVRREAIEIVLERIEEHSSGAPGWLEQHGADSRAIGRWRERIRDEDAR